MKFNSVFESKIKSMCKRSERGHVIFLMREYCIATSTSPEYFLANEDLLIKVVNLAREQCC